MEAVRCGWANNSQEERFYHDTRWGRETHDERELFKMLILEGMQAGLSWAVILKKEEALSRAFDGFAPEKMAAYDNEKIGALLKTEGIIKNRLKINAAVNNAKAYLRLCGKYGSLDAFLWGFVGGKPIVNCWEKLSGVPARTPLSDEISKRLKEEGFQFAGSVIVYSLMQSVGMVNDHILSCAFRGERQSTEY